LPPITFDPVFPERHGGFLISQYNEIQETIDNRTKLISVFEVELHAVQGEDVLQKRYSAKVNDDNQSIQIQMPTMPNSYLQYSKEYYAALDKKHANNADIKKKQEKYRQNYKKQPQCHKTFVNILFGCQLANDVLSKRGDIVKMETTIYCGLKKGKKAETEGDMNEGDKEKKAKGPKGIGLCDIKWTIAIQTDMNKDIDSDDKVESNNEEPIADMEGMLI